MHRLGLILGVALVMLVAGGVATVYLRPTRAAEPTARDIANAMRACVPIESIEADADFVKLKIQEYQWDGGSLMPNERSMIGNAEGHPHPIHTRIALVFARTWAALERSADGPIILDTRRRIVACFESVDLR
jgi:hypothetical protein